MANSDDGPDGLEEETPTHVRIDPGRGSRLLQVSMAILAALALIVALREARIFMMPTVLGGLLALAATPVCALLERARIPTTISAMVVTVSLFASVVAVGWFMLPSLDEWRYRAPEVAITLERKLRRIESQVEEVTKTAAKVAPDMKADSADASPEGGGADTGVKAEPEPEPASPTEQIVEGGRRMVTNVVAAAPEILGALMYMFFLIYFLMAERARVRRWAMMMAMGREQATRIGRTLLEIRRTVGIYLTTITLVNAALGVATAAAFYLIDMPAPILWGALMFVMNFMPYLGPLIVQACAFAVGFVTFSTTSEAFYPVLILLGLNLVEGQLITPLVLGSRMSVSPLAVFLAVAFGAWMWGAVGAIVATPALIVISGFVTLWYDEAQREEKLRLEAAAEAQARAEAEANAAAEAEAEQESDEASGAARA